MLRMVLTPAENHDAGKCMYVPTILISPFVSAISNNYSAALKTFATKTTLALLEI
jgi:hypothetical protein